MNVGDKAIWNNRGNKVHATIHHFSEQGFTTVAWLEADEKEVGRSTNPSSWYMAFIHDLEPIE